MEALTKDLLDANSPLVASRALDDALTISKGYTENTPYYLHYSS